MSHSWSLLAAVSRTILLSATFNSNQLRPIMPEPFTKPKSSDLAANVVALSAAIGSCGEAQWRPS